MRKTLQIAPRVMALLCVDVQEEHRQDVRYVVVGFDALMGHIASLQSCARAHEVPVLHAVYVLDGSSAPTEAFGPVTPDGLPAFSMKGAAWTEICAEVRPAAGEAVFVKSRASVFSNPEFATALRSRGIEWLLIAGVWSEACIDATVKDAIQHGFHVALVKDACGSGSMAMHQTAMLNLANRLYGGAMVTTEAAQNLLAGNAADVWMVEGSVPIRFDYTNAEAIYDTL